MKIQTIKQHFKENDSIIYTVISAMELTPLKRTEEPENYFQKLCREIISQQLAGKAAEAIRTRFYELFDNEPFTPKDVLLFSEQELRNVGMSWAKARYIRDLAQKVEDNEIRLDNLQDLEDDDVINELVKVKGIGNWTAEMFLIFTLGRENVFSYGDLGLIKGMQGLYGFRKKPTREKIGRIIEKWHPYKSYGCLALWHSIDS